MGISLTDLGNFATGAIERDREITNENLKIRAEELQANRDLMLAMKKDKYAADIAEYKKEKAKANEINRLNAVAAKGDMDSNAYAQQYLMATLGTEKYKIMQQTDPEGFKDMIANFGGAKDYKFTLDRNSLDKQLETDTKIINKGFSKAIEDAKGDSFLINKILGKKSSVNDDVNATIEDQLKAAQVVKEETVGSDTDLSTITFKESKGRLRTPPKEYQTEWKNQRGTINFDITKDGNAFKFLNQTGKLGGNDDISYSFNKTDGKIDKMNPPATENLLAMQYMFNQVKNSDDTMTLHYNNVTKNLGDIAKNWNTDTVYDKMTNILDGRGGNISEKGLDFRTDIRLTTFVPLSLVNQNNKMEFGNGTSIDFSNKSDMRALSNTMNKYILEKANLMYKNDNNVDEQNQAGRVYQRLYKGDATTMSEFLNYAAKENPELFKNIITSAESTGAEIESKSTEGTSQDKTIQDNKIPEKKSTMKFKVVTQDGKSGITANGKFRSWEELENANLISKLDDVTKLEYDKWKSSKESSQVKGTTFEDIQASTDANTKKITEAFTDSEGNFQKMKNNKTNIRPFSKG
jgi:hypothetical protein